MTLLGTQIDGIRIWAVSAVASGWATVAAAVADMDGVEMVIDKGVTWIFGAAFFVTLAVVVKLLNDRDQAYKQHIAKLESDLNIERAKNAVMDMQKSRGQE